MKFTKPCNLVVSCLTVFGATLNVPALAGDTLNLAQSMVGRFDYSEILVPLCRAAKDDPNDPRVHFLMGSLAMENGRHVRGELELKKCIELDPKSSSAKRARELLAVWDKELKSKGAKFAYTNLDQWLLDYLKTKKYDSTNPRDFEPKWATAHDKDREWKSDVHFISASFVHPLGGKPVSSGSKWTGELMSKACDNWNALAKKNPVEGSVDVYFRVNHDAMLEPTIVQWSGSPKFREIAINQFKLLNHTPALQQAAKENAIFKGRFAIRNKMYNEGTWAAFTSEDSTGPVRVSLETTFDPKKPKAPQIVETEQIRDTKRRTRNRSAPNMADKEVVNVRYGKPRQTGSAQKLANAEKLLQQKEFDKALDILWQLFSLYDLPSCYVLGRVYDAKEYGYPYPQPRLASLLYERAARMGNVQGIEAIADKIEWGGAYGTLGEAITYYKQGAHEGSAYCNLRLGILYEFGNGVEQNYDKAVNHYSLALKNGPNPAAQAGLQRIKTERKSTAK